MKKITLSLMALMIALTVGARTDDDRPIDPEKLPEKARKMILTAFPGEQIAFATQDDDWFGKSYEVHLNSGTEIEFTTDGEWTTVDAEPRAVPESILPKKIVEQVERRFPGRKVTKIERDRREYEVELDNGFELTFNLRFELIGMDD